MYVYTSMCVDTHVGDMCTCVCMCEEAGGQPHPLFRVCEIGFLTSPELTVLVGFLLL